MTNLLRLMVTEHVAEYIERGKRAAAALQQARATTEQSTTRAQDEASVGAFGRRRRNIQIDTGTETPVTVGTTAPPT
jgi:hypothetical protein